MGGGRNLKVGLFVLAGLLLGGLAIFLIGDERRLFASSVQFDTKFKDVQGLKSGAPIRMGGIDIGHVASVGYGKDPNDTIIYVKLDVVKSEAGRIKRDSHARIATKGLLGDKMIEITKGEDPVSIPPGGEILAKQPQDIMETLGGMGEKAGAALDNVTRVTEGLADERFQQDLRESVANVNLLLQQISGGDGYPHKFLTDKNESERISRTIDTLERTSRELTHTLTEVRGVVSRVKSGPGFAHSVIYGDGPQKQVEQFGNAAQELATTLKGVRESDSLAHDVLYGGKGNGAEAIANVTAITADLRTIVGNMKQGKGTVGALLVDPSVYEDLKMVLGNVERNEVLRALVRYSIKQDEKKPAVKVGGGATKDP